MVDISQPCTYTEAKFARSGCTKKLLPARLALQSALCRRLPEELPRPKSFAGWRKGGQAQPTKCLVFPFINGFLALFVGGKVGVEVNIEAGNQGSSFIGGFDAEFYTYSSLRLKIVPYFAKG